MTPKQKAALNDPPPADALKHREQGGTKLTYLEGQFVIETMNAIFDPDGWCREFCGGGLRVMSRREWTPPGKDKTRYDVSMMCEYRIKVGEQVIEDVGYGDGKSYQGWGESIESAAKEAVTDALKRCCRSLGNAMGNCLYDKAWLSANTNGDARVPYPSGDPPPARTQPPVTDELGF